MKKKVWSATPAFYVISAALLVLACISWNWDRLVFAVEISISVVSFIVVFVATVQFKAYVATSVKAAQRVLSAQDKEALDAFTMPVALIGAAGDVVWVNNAFFQRIIYPQSLDQIVAAAGTDVTVQGRQYSVFGARLEEGVLLYFVDDTYYKEINREYTDSRPVVGLAFFDNREELARDSSSSEDSRIASEVETALYNWRSRWVAVPSACLAANICC